jgi:hypothetical protein
MQMRHAAIIAGSSYGADLLAAGNLVAALHVEPVQVAVYREDVLVLDGDPNAAVLIIPRRSHDPLQCRNDRLAHRAPEVHAAMKTPGLGRSRTPSHAER